MTGQANFLQSLGWAVLNSLWQLALLWVVYQVITGLFRKASSNLKSSLASSLLIGGFAWFLYTFFSSFTHHAEPTIISSVLINPEGNQELGEWLQRTLPVASVVYLVLLLLPILHFIRNYRYVQVIRKYGLSKINADWRIFVNKVAGQMNIRKKVQIWVSEFVSSPVTVGFLKPVILVPLAAINHLTPQQLEAVILHELSHIRRNDYLINLVINFIQVILYFNPFVKALVRIVDREREKSCDEVVLQFQYNSHEYASALLTLEKASVENKPLAIAAVTKRDLLHRIELIMGVQQKQVLSFQKLTGLLSGLLCIIAVNAIILFSKPAAGSNGFSFIQPVTSSLALIRYNQPALTAELPVAEQPARVINHTVKDKPAPGSSPSFADYVSTVIAPAIITASHEIPPPPPELKKYQEEQVARAMEASKKVLENVQWKVVEKSIADVFNQKEKEELKASYEKELQKMDWEKWENSLKQAYDRIDWEKINMQLATAVNQVRLDSIQMVYNKAISQLDGARSELTRNGMKGIPDSDISLKEIEQKKSDVMRALNELRTIRNKKIVRL